MKVYIGRQPIFDRMRRVVAYELLFRSGPENFFSATDGTVASQQVVNSSMSIFGLHLLTGGKPAFVNVTQELLLNGLLLMLPPNLFVLEVLETVEPTEEVVEACRQLKQHGFLLALDDFALRQGYEPLIALADIVKVDFLQVQGAERFQIAQQLANTKVRLLAEKVETHEDFDEARQAGYDYFQGFFFSKPNVLVAQDLPAQKLTYLRLMQEMAGETLDFRRLEAVFRSDVALSFKLLRYINSAAMGLRFPITSIQQAMVMLGEKNLRRWVLLTLTASLLEDKPTELLMVGVVRGRFCEQACQRLRWRALGVDPFLVGLFSILDALLDRPLSELLTELPIAPEIRDALLGKPNLLGRLLRLIIAYEQADWTQVTDWATKVGLPEEEIATLYIASVAWAEALLHGAQKGITP